MVHDLKIPGADEWDSELIQELFLQDDVDLILSLPVGHSNSEDCLIWNFEKTGIYSIRSGYQIAYNQLIDSQPMQVPWFCIWSFNIPLKVKSFMWRLCSNILPTRAHLCSKGLAVDNVFFMVHMMSISITYF